MVRKILRRQGIAGADLLDLTQRVFLIAFVRLPTFEGRSTLSSWIHGICTRVTSAHRRSAIVRHELSTDPGTLARSQEAVQTVSAEAGLAGETEARRAIGKLPEAQRLVFVLFEVYELDGPEIASLLNIPMGTVRSRLRYARRALRREVRGVAARDALCIERLPLAGRAAGRSKS
jgi:RNA polymerase sigma-70 factor (ECF subfamily)